MENLDLREILKNVPKGTKLYSTAHGDINFNYIDYNNVYSIICYGNHYRYSFTKEGKLIAGNNGECLLFPSKEQRDWSKFELPCQFKLGDVLISNGGHCIAIFNKKDCLPIGGDSNTLYYNCFYNIASNRLEIGINYGIGTINNYHHANKEERTFLFDKLQEAGYFWNGVTNSLEKYKFKIGTKIQNIASKNKYKIVDISHDYYILENKSYLKCSDQNKYTKEKFDITTLKHYDKVLIRYGNNDIWTPQIFSYLDNNFKQHCYKFVIIGGASVPQCISYKGNEHLTETTNDCDEYYKTW